MSLLAITLRWIDYINRYFVLTRKLQNLLSSKLFALINMLLVFGFIVILGEMVIDVQRGKNNNAHIIETLSHAATLRARIERELNTLLYLNSGLSGYLVVRNNQIQADEMNDMLAVLYRTSRHIRNFGIAIGYRLTYVYPLSGNQKAVGINYADLPDQFPVIQKIVTSGQASLAGPLPLVQGGTGLIYRIPLFIKNQYWGLLSTVIDSNSLFSAIFEMPLETQEQHNRVRVGEYEYAIRGKDGTGSAGEVILGNPHLFEVTTTLVQTIEIPGGHWMLAVARHSDDFIQKFALLARFISGLLGGLIAAMLYALLRHRAELLQLVMFDSLTNLPNRRLLQDRAHLAFSRQRRFSQKSCALLFIDLDGFKHINDIYGHKAGDAVLREAAQRASNSLRIEDTVARWGGDEFIVLLEKVSLFECERLKNRLRINIETPIMFNQHTLTVGASIGVAFYPQDGLDLETLLRVADQNMYQNKLERKTKPRTSRLLPK
jgi:diguanylate cyclase (GGDEF)-like protein